jgi:hypothetical protein
MEWILILPLLSGTIVVPRPFHSEEECIGAGEKAQPQCTQVLGLFDRVQDICTVRRFICVPQPRSITPIAPRRRALPSPPR